MKKTILAALLVLLSGCSFSKNPSSESDKARESRVDDLMKDTRYSNVRKVQVSIERGMWDVFSSILPKLNRVELNSLAGEGETLGQIALRLNRLDFLEALLKAGMSPFRRSFTFNAANDTYVDIYRQSLRLDNHQASTLIKKYRDSMLGKSAKLCAISLPELVQYLDENYISPMESVCGRKDLFANILSAKDPDRDSINLILSHYFNDGQDNGEGVPSRVFQLAVRYLNEEVLTKFDLLCSRGMSCSVSTDDFEAITSLEGLEKVVKSFLVIRKNLKNNADFVKELEAGLFRRVKAFTGQELETALQVLERNNLRSEYDQIAPQLQEVVEKKNPSVEPALPAPPGPGELPEQDDVGQGYSIDNR